jgi:cytidylate kinase
VTLSGLAGSGKTTVAQIVAKSLHLPHVSSGMVFRDMAKEKNMDLEKFGDYVSKHPEIDKEIDDRQLALARKGNVILEGRLSGWVVHNNNVGAVKIWLDASLETRVKRIVGREKKSYEKALSETGTRESCEIQRYKKQYDINLMDLSIYDVVVDTEKWDQHQVSDIVIESLGRNNEDKRA